MCQKIATRGRHQDLWRVEIDGLRKCGQGLWSFRQGGQQRILPHLAMGQKLCDAQGGGPDRRAVSGQQASRPERRKQRERVAVISHITVRGGDQGAGPTHDDVTGKNRASGLKANVISEMARCVQSRQGNAASADRFSMGKQTVRYKGAVHTLTSAFVAPFGPGPHCHASACIGGTKCQYRRASGCRKGRGEGGVVKMGMRDKDAGNSFTRMQRRQDSPLMGGQVGPRVDDRDIACAHQIGVRASPGHGRGVGGQYKPQPGDFIHQPRLFFHLWLGHDASRR